MAAHKGQINYGVRFDVDKQSLQQVKTELQAIQKMTLQEFSIKNADMGLKEAQNKLIDIKREATALQGVLDRAFNADLGSLNLTKFDNELKKSNIDLQSVYKNFKLAGATGTQEFQKLSSAVLTSNLQLRQTHNILDNIAQTMFNTAKWGIASSAFNNMTSSIQRAWDYTVKLDTSLNDIRIVSGKSANEMERFAKQANAASQRLGASTRDYTNAALIYYQQGLNDAESQARAEVTVKAANVTRQSGEEVSEQLTAIWNGYKVSAEETELYIDKVAKVAASTAADLEEMATAMSKVASAANSAGVDIDRLNGMLSTVISVTREAPETIGTSFRTIFARLGDLKLGKTDEDGVDLGTVSGQLESLGIQILDRNGDMRDMGDIIEDVAKKWEGWTQAQRQAAAIAMAGQRQYSRLIALFDNWDMYTKAVDDSRNAVGELQKEQDIYMESTAAHLKQLQTAWERVYDAAVDNGKANGIIDVLTGLTNGVANWVEAMGSGTNVLLTLGSVATSVFSKQIASSINTTIANFQMAKQNAEQLRLQLEQLRALDKAAGGDGTGTGGDVGTATRLQERERMEKYIKSLTTEQIQEQEQLIDKYAEAKSQQQQLVEKQLEAAQIMASTSGKPGEGGLTQEEALKAIQSPGVDSAEYEKFTEYIANAEKLKKQYNDTQAAVKDLIKTQQEYAQLAGSGTEEEEKAQEKLEAQLDDVIQKFKDLKTETSGMPGVEQDAINGQIAKLEQARTKNFSGEDSVPNADELEKAFIGADKAAAHANETFTKQVGIVQEVTKETANQNYEVQSLKTQVDNLDKSYTRLSKIDAFTKLASGATMAASGIASLVNIIDIWNNKDLSGGEKALQIFMALGTGLPMLLTGLKSVKTALIALAPAEATAAGGAATMWSAILGPVGLVIAGIAAVGVAIYALVKAYNADADAAKKAEEEAKRLKDAYNETKTAADELKRTLEDYKSAIKTIASLEKGTTEWKQAILEANDKALELLKNYKELSKYTTRDKESGLITISEEGYDKILEDQLRKLERAQQLYAEGEVEALEARQKSNITDFRRSHTYKEADSMWAKEVPEEIIKDIAKYMEKNNLSNLIEDDLNNISSVTSANSELRQSIIDNIDAYANLGNEINGTKDQQKLYADEIAEARLKLKGGDDYKNATPENKQVYDLLYETYNNNAEQKEADIKAKQKDLFSYEAYLKEYYPDLDSGKLNAFQEAMQAQVAADVYADTHMFNQTGIDLAKKYAKVKGFNTDKVDYTGFLGLGGYKFYDDEGNTLEVNGWDASGIEEKIAKAEVELEYAAKAAKEAPDLISSVDEFIRNSGLDSLNNYDAVLSNLFKSGGDGKLQGVNSVMSQAQAQELLGNEEGLKAIEETLQNSDFWKRQGFESAEKYMTAFKEWLQNRSEISDAEALGSQAIGQLSGNMRKTAEQFQSGDLTPEQLTDEYKAVVNQMETLERIYPELTPYVETFNDTALIGTEEWANSLYILNEKINELNLQRLNDEAKKAFDELKKTKEDFLNENGELEIEAWLQSEKFQEKLEDLLNKDYAIDVEIHAQAEDAFEAFEAASENMAKQAAKIGENYIVAAEDIRELNNAFPGIIQGMEAVGDGTVRLNKTIVQSAMDSANAELAASADSTLGQLENQAKVLRGKQATYQAMYEAALALSKGEGDADALTAEIKKGFDDLEAQNNQALSDSEMDNAEAVATDSNTQAGIMAANWNSAYSSAADSAIAFARTAVAAAQAAQKGEGTVTKGDFGVNYQGRNGQSSEAAKLAELKDVASNASSSQDYAKLAQSFKNAADAAGRQANDIEGMMAQIGARTVDYGKQFGNIASGKGSNPKSGGGSGNDPDTMDYLEEIADRYHEVDTQIQLIDKHLSLLESQQEKLFGKDLLDNLNAQLKELDKQITNYNEKIRIAKDESAELRSQLAAQGVSFNADGTISNYVSAFNAQENYVNSVIANYNSMSAEAQKGYKDVVEKAKKDFETFKTNLDRYDELVSEVVPELEQQIQDAIDKQIEINVQKFNMEIEIRLDMSKAERDWNEFKKKVIDGIQDSDILGNARARLTDYGSYYKSDGTGVIQRNTQHVNDIVNELRTMENGGRSSIYGDNETQALEDLKTYYEQLMSDLKDIRQLEDDMHQSYLKEIDEVNTKLNDQVKMYEQVQSLINHNMKVIQLIGGDDSYSQLRQYYQMQEDNYNKSLDFQRQQVDFWKQQMDAMEEGSEEWEKAKKNWIDAVNTWENTVENAIENIRDKFENAINDIFDRLNDKVTNGWGLEYVNEEWGLINKNADQYLDTINAMYGIRDLEKKYLDAIDQTDSVSAQRKLNALMEEEVKALKDKDRLTQYDVERAEKKYQIALAQIALEEAQQNKSNMRLRRDSQGNYTYQFVADENAVGDAEDNLDALRNELYNFDLARYRDNLDQIYEIWDEYQQKMAEAAMINDPEERAERELLLNEQYGELINGLVEQNETVRTNLHESAFTELADLYEVDLANFQTLSDEEQDVLLSDMIPQWESGVQQMADVFAGEGGFVPTCEDAMNELAEVTQEYQDDLNELQSTAGFTYSELENGIDQVITDTQELIYDNTELINKYGDELQAVKLLLDELKDLTAQYQAAKDAAIAATEAAYKYWQFQNGQAAAAAGNGGSGSGSGGSGSGSGSGGSGGGSGSGGSGGGAGGKDGQLSVGDTATYSGKYYYDSYGSSPTGSKYSGVGDGIVIDRITNNPYGIHIHSADGRYGDLGWIKRSQLSGYDTGGYTGQWSGNTGKLALLHQKELVLNAQDTQNILNAVEIMRSVSSAMLSKVAGLMAGTNAPIGGAAAGQLEQDVHIEANFPNVTSSNEIEEAINNLVNIASQRAYKG